MQELIFNLLFLIERFTLKRNLTFLVIYKYKQKCFYICETVKKNIVFSVTIIFQERVIRSTEYFNELLILNFNSGKEYIFSSCYDYYTC